MNIFLSYASARRDVAMRLKLALEAEGHDVFFDRDDLGAGESFHEAIRGAVQAAQLMIFLVSPESVRPGSYTRAELDMAQQLHPRPAGRVLPVVVAATPKAEIPPYLMAVTLLEPPGDVVAGTLAAVARLAAPRRRTGLWVGVAATVALLVAAGFIWRQVQAQRAAEQAAADAARAVAQANEALALCLPTSRTDALAQLARLAAVPQAPVAVHEARESCAMRALREARVSSGATFEAYAAPLRAVLIEGLALQGANAPQGVRAADLQAHLGWADALVWRDLRDTRIDPVPRYQRALALDAANPYAHAMWAHWLFLRGRGDSRAQDDEAARHFDAALAAGRDREFVRSLQFGVFLGLNELNPRALQALDSMRRGNEAVPTELKPRLWSSLFASPWHENELRDLREALPPEAMLATFTWLFPAAAVDRSRQPMWRYLHALLLTQAGRGADARADLLALQQELRADKNSGPFPDGVNRLAAQLR